MGSPMRRVSKETRETLGPHSSPFQINSIRSKLHVGDKNVVHIVKHQKLDSVDQFMKQFTELNEKVKKLESQIRDHDELNTKVKKLESQSTEHQFWLNEMSTFPILAIFEIIKIFLVALNVRAKVLVEGRSLVTEFNDIGKKDRNRAEPFPYYVFLHGILHPNGSTFGNKEIKKQALEDLHKDFTGIEGGKIEDCLESLSIFRDERNEGGHPIQLGIGGKKDKERKEKLLRKVEEMMKGDLLPSWFNETHRQLLILALEYSRSLLHE